MNPDDYPGILSSGFNTAVPMPMTPPTAASQTKFQFGGKVYLFQRAYDQFIVEANPRWTVKRVAAELNMQGVFNETTTVSTFQYLPGRVVFKTVIEYPTNDEVDMRLTTFYRADLEFGHKLSMVDSLTEKKIFSGEADDLDLDKAFKDVSNLGETLMDWKDRLSAWK